MTVPARIRREAGIEVGTPVVVYIEDGWVVIETRQQLVDRLRREVAEAWIGDPRASVVDKLLADRRADAAREAEAAHDAPSDWP